MAKIIIDVKDIINMTDTYTVAEYAEEGRTIAEWVETLGKLEEALKKLKQETRRPGLNGTMRRRQESEKRRRSWKRLSGDLRRERPRS